MLTERTASSSVRRITFISLSTVRILSSSTSCSHSEYPLKCGWYWRIFTLRILSSLILKGWRMRIVSSAKRSLLNWYFTCLFSSSFRSFNNCCSWAVATRGNTKNRASNVSSGLMRIKIQTGGGLCKPESNFELRASSFGPCPPRGPNYTMADKNEEPSWKGGFERYCYE